MDKNKDLYEILELNRNATEEQIKKNYRKLALRYHPDRQGDKSDKEKKEAEEKFKDISFAYSILSNPESKQRYDQFGITDDNGQMGGDFDPSEMFEHFMGSFGSMFGNDERFSSFFGGTRKQPNQPTPGQSVRMQVPVSIQEIMNGVHRDIKYDINVRCSKCHGSGGDGVEKCPHCHGTGMITEVQRSGFGIIQNCHPCHHCGGTGTIIKNKCPECHGTGFKKKEVSVSVNIPGGFNNGYQTVIRGKGYESKHLGYDNGDLLLEFIYNFDTNKFAVNNNIIYEFVSIPYYDCILGKDFEHVLPNGDKVKVKIPQYTQDKTVIDTGKRYGSKQYNLVVFVKMPTYIRESEKKLLEQIKKENN